MDPRTSRINRHVARRLGSCTTPRFLRERAGKLGPDLATSLCHDSSDRWIRHVRVKNIIIAIAPSRGGGSRYTVKSHQSTRRQTDKHYRTSGQRYRDVSGRIRGDNPHGGESVGPTSRSEEHTAELQSHYSISYAVFACQTPAAAVPHEVP